MTILVADVEALWAAVVSRYATSILASLTNVNAPEATTVNTTVGESAARSVLGLWPAYAQVEWDQTDALHLEVAVRGVIAELWQRGGSSSQSAQIEWNEVFGDGGMIEQVRRTGPRAHAGPATNSGVQQSPETSNGRPVQGWSDTGSLPYGLLPIRRLAD